MILCLRTLSYSSFLVLYSQAATRDAVIIMDGSSGCSGSNLFLSVRRAKGTIFSGETCSR